MSTNNTLDIKPRILYRIAKAAWEGKLMEQREEICQLVHDEFKNNVDRRYVANQIRLAMGLPMHDSDSVINDFDNEALMGMGNEPVIIADPASCKLCPEGDRACQNACPFDAINHDTYGKVSIDYDKCMGEGHCVQACSFGALSEKTQFVPLINLLRQNSHPVYASVAPAFAGQFGENVTAGKLRSALINLGFVDMVETALYADLITMKEAFEFDDHVKTEEDFLLTSCCCPVWIKLIENKFPELIEHISPTVSPMIASARVIKAFNSEAKVVFIGPCVAKKSEAMLPDLKGSIDFVLTFQELATIFEAAEIHPEDQADEESSHASLSGRIYAHTGGVSKAVEKTLNKLVPNRVHKLKALCVDGIPDCQQVLSRIQNGNIGANFIEGMACKGGCVGGPGRIINASDGKQYVVEYGDKATAETPVENPQVYAILARLGQESQELILTGESPMAKLLARKLK
ncbi:[Fe-Fe] hydrogenase large subunit C-terminal domain-containing protein [Dendrosporobacter sp. 1207_IL3150]|uniref:[Fe-Fe] hydrogenase large subunit C-terminal domain-containing protein n=1 Tax=Dendrosporobacter sp. 1207_IL3150 TaxID=3084054 RepID=UPI002FD8F5F1